MRFRRLSAPGAAALSLWELQAPVQELQARFGPLPEPGGFRVARAGGAVVFDEGLLWLQGAVAKDREPRSDEDAADTPGGSAVWRAELHLHGGPGIADALRRWLSAAGWNERPPGDGEDEVERGFRGARTVSAARAWGALRGGAFERRLEEIEAMAAPARAVAARAALRHAGWAELLEAPPRVVLAGPPNAGKSTLLNAWLGRPRATVSPLAGTTRDAVRALCAVGSGEDAVALQLVDTAGLWTQAGGVDAEAVARSRAEIASAWRTVWVFDASTPPDAALESACREHRGAQDLLLLHRTDLGESWSPEQRLGGEWLRGSALREPAPLLAALEGALLAPLGPAPPADALLPLGRHRREALRALASVRPPRG